MVSIIWGGVMPSRKLPLALCVAQTAETAILTFWADRMEWLRGDSNRIPPHFVKLHLAVLDLREVWRGINAPTFPFNFAGLKPFSLLGLSVPEILYLIAVAVLWYLVGYFREQRKMQKNRVVAIAILLWGLILLLLSIVQMPEAFLWTFAFGRIFRPNRFLNALLYAVWALVLIRFGVKNLRAFSQTQQNGRS
jgi:hypothetical protein